MKNQILLGLKTFTGLTECQNRRRSGAVCDIMMYAQPDAKIRKNEEKIIKI